MNIWFFYTQIDNRHFMCLSQAFTVFKKVAYVWTHGTLRWQLKMVLRVFGAILE
jgi:hypothetical protein